MQSKTFVKTLGAEEPPPQITEALRAMWHDAKGNWEAAHTIAQDDCSTAGSWVHAYLHRKEGDLVNATYWYNRASQPVATGPHEKEWEDIITALSDKS